MLTAHPHLKSTGSWKGRAIPLLTLWAFVACYRENLYLPFMPLFFSTWRCKISSVHSKSLINWEPNVVRPTWFLEPSSLCSSQKVWIPCCPQNCQCDQREFGLYKDTLFFQRDREFVAFYSVRIEYFMKRSAGRLPFLSSISGCQVWFLPQDIPRGTLPVATISLSQIFCLLTQLVKLHISANCTPSSGYE